MTKQCCCAVCVSEGEVGIIENCSKFEDEANPGCTCVAYPLSCLAHSVSLRMQQINVTTETKTLDNVTLTVRVAVQFRVIPEKVEDGKARRES
jgi:regulator of protease activity HflC (stomatin/prohibitin superfamily)